MAELKLENIYPTLFIGLGGAGGHVLSRLNQLFERDFGHHSRALDASPLQFLLLDTDDLDKLPHEVRNNLGDRERNFLSLSHFNPRRYAEGQLAFTDSDLHRWFDRRILPFLEDAMIHDGASRLRALGRLCLHHRYHEVEQRIRQKFEEAMDAKVHAAAQRIKPEPRPFRVFIVSSSCGGTGSALFVDIASMVNRIVRDRGTTPEVQGFVFLPFPFIEANAQIDPALESFYQHNAWAFFEELNHVLRNPEQLANVALDPGRAYGDPPRPFDYGRDLMRTIYLVGHHIPPVGTLDLGDPLYSYVAHGIYHVFLTPEESRIQSSYSNIKTKLQEPDRSFGLVKRFATFGYAEYRLAPARFGDRIARLLVERERAELLGAEPREPVVARAAAEMLRHVERAVDAERDAALAWAPRLPAASAIVTDESGDEIARRVRQLATVTARDLDRQRAEASARAESAAARDRIEALLEQRLSDVPDGLRVEQRAVERFQQDLIAFADRLTSAEAEAPLEADTRLADRLGRLARDAAELDRRLLRAGPLRRDASRVRRLEADLTTALNDLAEGARRRLVVELEREIGQALREVAEGGWLNGRRAAIGRLLGALDQPLQWADVDGAKESPTIQQIPPDSMLRENETNLRSRADAFHIAHAGALEPRRRALWARLRASPGDAAALKAMYEGLYHEWSRHAAEAVPAPEDLLEAWSAWRANHESPDPVASAADDGAVRADGVLKRLIPLSAPACPIAFDRMHKQDTAALITVGVGRFDHVDDARARLGVSGPFDLIENGGDRYAVLQTCYAFSSRAIEGMETLRRSYLDRDTSVSFPHVHAEWNEHGLEDAATRAVPFTPAECRLIARAFALGELVSSVERLGAGPAPGLRIELDPRDVDPFYLLRYADAGGWPALKWRDLRPVDGFTLTWQATNGADREPAAANGSRRELVHDLAEYLGSPVRQRHARFLDEVLHIERSEPHGRAYLEAYRRYRERLAARIDEERRRNRVKHVPLLEALARALDEHVADVQRVEAPLL